MPLRDAPATRLSSHAFTAAVLCIAAAYTDARLRYDAWEARHVAHVELVLALYGITFAAIALARAKTSPLAKAPLVACLPLFAYVGYMGTLMTRVVHN